MPGFIMVNGQSYGAGTPVMVTQEQYDALPDSKYSDNIMYLIKDGSEPEDVEFTDAAANIFYDNSESSLQADNVQRALDELSVMKREVMAPYGYFGVEYDIDELMSLVREGEWGKFAIGDYFIETTSSGEKIMWEVAGKNSYLHCGDTELNKNHIVCCPRDCLETYYKFNTTNTNAGGYAASLMPANLETEANKFSSKLQGYMTTIRRLENNKGGWAWASRRILLPGIVELCGSPGFADGWSGGAFNQLPLFVGGNAHILKGAGFNKKKNGRVHFWTADSSAANSTNFCHFTSDGYSTNSGAANDLPLAPLIVLSNPDNS